MAEDAEQLSTFEELADSEADFHDIDTEILRRQYILSHDAYARRGALIAKIPHFWTTVMEQAPTEIDQLMSPADAIVFSMHLTNLEVERFEIPSDATLDAPGNGEPRSLLIRFHFGANDFFSDEVLEKRFWYRRDAHDWAGLVSEPVTIHWKKGMDLTDGLGDLALRFWQAEQKALERNEEVTSLATVQALRELPEFKPLAERVEKSVVGSRSFFTWFAYRGPRVSAEQSRKAQAAARAKIAARRATKSTNGTSRVEPDKDANADVDADTSLQNELDYLLEQTEVFPDGEDAAVAIADELWPFAIKYFTAQYDEDDDESEEDFVEEEEDEEEDEGRKIGYVKKRKDERADASNGAAKGNKKIRTNK